MNSVRYRELRLANKRWERATAWGCDNSMPKREYDAAECERLLQEYWKIVEEGE